MYVIETQPIQPTALPGIAHVTVAGRADGLARLSIWRQRMAAGGATPPHRHDCEEVVIIESGRGELHVDGVIHRFQAGNTLVLPARVLHQIVNTGDADLETTAVFDSTPVPTWFPDGSPIELPWST